MSAIIWRCWLVMRARTACGGRVWSEALAVGRLDVGDHGAAAVRQGQDVRGISPHILSLDVVGLLATGKVCIEARDHGTLPTTLNPSSRGRAYHRMPQPRQGCAVEEIRWRVRG